MALDPPRASWPLGVRAACRAEIRAGEWSRWASRALWHRYVPLKQPIAGFSSTDVPDHCTHLLVHTGAHLYYDEGRGPQVMPRAALIRRRDFARAWSCDGELEAVSLRFWPWLSPEALGFDRGDPARILSLDWPEQMEVASNRSPGLLARVMSQLRTWLPRTGSRAESMDRRWMQAVLGARPRTPIGLVARSVGTSERSLERFCMDLAGLTPKRIQAIGRLRRALDRLHSEPAMALADIAMACHYTDQSHMSHDFRKFRLLPPGRFRRSAHLASRFLPCPEQVLPPV